MLRYLATVTLGVGTTVSACILAECRATVNQSSQSDHQHQLTTSSQFVSSPTRASSQSLTKMDYRQEADRIANKVYELYKDTEWKIAKSTVSCWQLLFYWNIFYLYFHYFLVICFWFRLGGGRVVCVTCFCVWGRLCEDKHDIKRVKVWACENEKI